MTEDDLRKRGDEASRFVAGLRAAKQQPSAPRQRFRKKGTRLADDWLHDPRAVALQGGYQRYMSGCEQRILDEARQRIAEERPRWRRYFVEMIELHLKHETDPWLITLLKSQLRKAQKTLGLLQPTPETVREQTRERVRRHREREKKRTKRPAKA